MTNEQPVETEPSVDELLETLDEELLAQANRCF